MKIQLLSLTLINFKGVRSFTAEFNHTTNILGGNATGKTTLFDAFTWLLFGKDSTDRKDFEVKTLDDNNLPIPKIEHEVSALLDVDGQTVRLKRIMKEKWVKKRGTPEPEFTGNETLYCWNDVPMQQGEYQAKINGMVEEGLFKLITNTLYFNSMKWQDRRSVLMSLAGHISNDEVLSALEAAGKKGDFIGLLSVLNQGKSIAEYKAEIASKKKLIKTSLDMIPTRIDEANRAIPETQDWAALEGRKGFLVGKIGEIDNLLLDASKRLQERHNLLGQKQNKQFELKTQFNNRQNAIKTEFNNKCQQRSGEVSRLQSRHGDITSTIAQLNGTILANNNRIASINQQLADLRTKWDTVTAEQLTFKEGQFECPSCKRALEEHDVNDQKAKLTENFNTSKAKRLQDLTDQAMDLKRQVTDLTDRRNTLQGDLIMQEQDLASVVNTLNDAQAALSSASANDSTELGSLLENDLDLKSLKGQIDAIQLELTAATHTPDDTDNTQLLQDKRDITTEIESINRLLNTKEQIEKADKRIEDLKTEEKDLAQQLANLEKTEFQIEKFIKAKMDMLEQRINGRFKLVRFKMFRTQINGGEEECCETLIGGVPFSDANNASKINAGLDIINTLSQHHNVSAPIFIDNAESVVHLYPSSSQLVRLVVSEHHEKLTVAA